jgi:hypothetical protein
MAPKSDDLMNLRSAAYADGRDPVVTRARPCRVCLPKV